MRARLSRSFLLPLALLLPACGPTTPEGALDANRAAIEARLDAIRAVGALAKAAPPVAADSAQLSGPPPAFVSCLGEDWNATAVHLEDLADLTRLAPGPGRLGEYSRTAYVASFAATGKRPSLPDGEPLPEAYLTSLTEGFGRLRYVLVVRVGRHQGGDYQGGETFTAGRQAGDARLYDLENRKQVAAFTYRAESRATVDYTTGREQENVDADLELAVGAALVEAIERVVPGARANAGDLI